PLNHGPSSHQPSPKSHRNPPPPTATVDTAARIPPGFRDPGPAGGMHRSRRPSRRRGPGEGRDRRGRHCSLPWRSGASRGGSGGWPLGSGLKGSSATTQVASLSFKFALTRTGGSGH
uniref:Uncharacterized protein n=1 Tax=Aegilops tauschii subsp. strangulata TaxID=200361 RepID=A0A453DJY2_AEGTS